MEGYATHYTPTQVDAIKENVSEKMRDLGLDVREEDISDVDPEFEGQHCFMIRGSWLAFEFYGGHGRQPDQMGLLHLVKNRWLVDQDETDFREVERAFQRLAFDQAAKQKGTA